MEEQLKQAKLKVLRLLMDMDRTEAQLREKLKEKGYSDEVIAQSIAYVDSFGYVNDARYAKRFVECKKQNKSRYELAGALRQKGVEQEIIDQALAECYPKEEEVDAIRHLLMKQHFSPEESTEEEKRKLSMRLARRGFHYEDIQKIIQVSSWNA